MSDRLSSSKKWTVALLLGAAGTAVVAGGIALGIYYVRKRRNAVPPQEPVHDETQPLIDLPVVEEPVTVVEEPIMPVVEETCTVTMDMKVAICALFELSIHSIFVISVHAWPLFFEVNCL